MILPLAIGSLFLAAASEGPNDNLKRAWFLNDAEWFAQELMRKSEEEIDGVIEGLHQKRSLSGRQNNDIAKRFDRFIEAIKLELAFNEVVKAKGFLVLFSDWGNRVTFTAKITGRNREFLLRIMDRIAVRFEQFARQIAQQQRGVPVDLEVTLPSFEPEPGVSDGVVEIVFNTWPDDLDLSYALFEDFFKASGVQVME
jgi:hypothetical protein